MGLVYRSRVVLIYLAESLAESRCKEEKPAWREMEEIHFVACHEI
ncbi:hypothetical protein [Pseudalkalibacillus caeni]|nr:hypothetical protein [Pseudalkalibacillus caeni]